MRVPANLETRAQDGEILVRVSNDRLPDAYNTRITAEALVEWLGGFLSHRSVNLEHRQETLVGYAVGADFTPDLVVRIRLNEEGKRLVNEGAVVGASIEFVPLESYLEEEHGVVVYTAVSPEPELTGLALTASPAVPGAKILGRSAYPLWAYAVVDPVVWELALPQEEAVRFCYFPHHDPKTRLVDLRALKEAVDRVMAEAVEPTPGGRLSAQEIISRAKAHLERHVMGILVPQASRRSFAVYNGLDDGGRSREVKMEKDLEVRNQEPELEVDLEALNEAPKEVPQVQAPAPAAPAVEARKESKPSPRPSAAWPEVRARGGSPVAEGLFYAMRAVFTGAGEDVAKANEVLYRSGFGARSIELAGPNTVLISDEVVREVFLRPDVGSILRNHYTVESVPGTLVIRGVGFTGGVVAAFDNEPLNLSAANHEGLEQVLRPLRVAAEVSEEFSTFNLLGPAWIENVFLPEVRRAAAKREDDAFFHGSPNQDGLLSTRRAVQVDLAPSDYGNTPAIKLLSQLVATLPAAYKGQRTNLAIYAEALLVERAIEEVISRQTALGDAVLADGGGGALAGPEPALRVRGVNVYYAPQLDATSPVKAVLVYRPGVRVAQGLALRARYIPQPGFKDRIEFQEYIGWLFRYPDAIVRLALSQ